MPDKLSKKLYREVSKELEIPYEEVVSIMKSATSYVRHVMEHSGFETVHLPYLGKFLVKPKRLQYYNENRIKYKSGGVI